jgi:hypothetical protein
MSKVSTDNSNPVTDWGNSLYDGASGVGVFKAELMMVVAIIVAALLVVMGLIMIMYNDDDKYLRIKGQVVQPNCVLSGMTKDTTGNPTNNYKCNMSVKYIVNGKEYNKTIFVSGSANYIPNEPVDLVVLRSDFNNVQIAQMNMGTAGTLMISGAFAIVAAAYINYYLTHNYKVYAATQGVSTLTGLFRY